MFALPISAFGATHRKQGAAYYRVIGEEIRTTYGADLEIFVEKRIGGNFTIRAVGSNLLNGAKRETFNKFDNLADQQARDFDEYELESEKAGRSEERRVGKECVSTCRYRGSPNH